MDIILGTGSTLESNLKLSISRANKKQRMKNITKYGHNCKHRKHITITFQVVNFYSLIILITLASSPHTHFKETYSLRGNSGILEFQSKFVCRPEGFLIFVKLFHKIRNF